MGIEKKNFQKPNVGSSFSPLPSSFVTKNEVKLLGTLYLLKPLLERMNIAEIIDSIVPNYEKYGQKETTGKIIEVLVANRLSSSLPMYEIMEWANSSGIEVLFDVTPSVLNDDRLARALKYLDEYFDEIQTAIILHVIKEFEIDPSIVLWDSTSIYFEGEYDQSQTIDFGYGSDKKQIKLAFSIDEESGIPLLGSIINGNINDQSIVIETMKALLGILKQKDILFTGDKAVGTIPNCLRLHHYKIKFVAPCPADNFFTEIIDSISPEEFEQYVYNDEKANPIFKAAERNVFIYTDDKIILKELELENIQPFWGRCLFIWSRSKEELERKKRNKTIKKIQDRLEDIKTTKLNHRCYKKNEYAQKQVDNCFKRRSAYLKNVFGNPQVNGPTGSLTLNYQIDKDLLTQIEKRDGIFPVVSNVLDSEEFNIETLFLITRKKYNVERPMRYIKSNVKIRPIFLHLDEHINGLILVTIIALKVIAFWNI